MHRAVKAGQDALLQKQQPWQITPSDFFDAMQTPRALFARLIGSAADNIAIVPSASYGIALAAANLPVPPNQKILVLAEQFPSNIYAWRRLAQEKNARIHTVPRPPDSDWTTAVLNALDAQTAVAALANCHWTDGSRIDLEKIGARCREVNAALVIDGTQSIGALPFDVTRVQPDFLVTIAHKWLLGPYSYAFCYVAPQWCQGRPLEENWLNRAGSEDFTGLIDYRDDYQPGARRFDMGEGSHFILAPIAATALDQILSWDAASIAATLQHHTDRIAAEAQRMGFTVPAAAYRTPHLIGISHRAGLPKKIAAVLAAEKIFVSIRGNAIRIAPHVYNTPADIDRLLAVLRKVI